MKFCSLPWVKIRCSLYWPLTLLSRVGGWGSVMAYQQFTVVDRGMGFAWLISFQYQNSSPYLLKINFYPTSFSNTSFQNIFSYINSLQYKTSVGIVISDEKNMKKIKLPQIDISLLSSRIMSLSWFRKKKNIKYLHKIYDIYNKYYFTITK